MPQQNYIWIFQSDSLINKDADFSSQYLLSEKDFFIDSVQGLVGSRIWMIMRDTNTDYLYGSIEPQLIERYVGGAYSGDYLIEVNNLSSVRYLPRLESVKSWSLKSAGRSGIRVCESDEVEMFYGLIETNTRVNFRAISENMMSSVRSARFEDLEYAVPEQLGNVLQSLAFGDIHKKNSSPLTAFGYATLQKLITERPDIDRAEAERLIATNEVNLPIKQLSERHSRVEGGKTMMPPRVDTVLEEIDVGRIAPREFVAGNELTLDWLGKTNAAEEAHESMLSDIVQYLQQNRYRTLRSRSFDLVTQRFGDEIIFELKSATKDNVLSQAEKALIQLLRYRSAVKNETADKPATGVIIQDVDEKLVHAYLDTLCKEVGIELWLYDKNKEWPKRLARLDGKTF